ncbi:FecR domain-containing protein [Gilvimarinus sp. DA14]|uniref:FecR family protein n=1 Tax=Gilvimarinus sp. DA14 TaxID=2956798 RepID=UPI0020B8705E|nr:FecR domain-containing protein [Gilvimarinus sp. DA14]UTF60234.1 FecR domain-containing protein [Gilvimarinus sp. DA14]
MIAAPDNNSEDRIYDEAAEWIDRLADGRLDKITSHRLYRWLQSDARHRQVLEAMLATWQDPQLERAAQQALQSTPLAERYQVASRSWRYFFYSCAGSAAVVALLFLLMPVLWQSPEVVAEPQVYRTANTSDRQMTLADGSAIELAASSRLVTDFKPERRNLSLERGAAYFAVAPDKSRPFEVTVGRASVVAVGTEFNIDRHQDGTDVTVYEGAIEVREQPLAKPRLLRGGERVRITRQGLEPTQAVDLQSLVDWRSGWIDVENESLSVVLEKLGRYSLTPIELADHSLASLRVAGRFRLSDTETALAMLDELYPIDVERRDQRIWVSLQAH